MNTSGAVRNLIAILRGMEALLEAGAKVVTTLIDELQLFRRLGMMLGFYVTYSSIEFCYAYAKANPSPEQLVGVAAVIGAVMAPVSAMQAALFKFYVDSSSARYRRKVQADATPVEPPPQ